MPRLILASSSPRRRELLSAAGYTFDVVPPGASAECGVCSKETPPEMVARLAHQKAADVARRVTMSEDGSPAIVIGCDTVAECAGLILGKPVDIDHARTMLQLLRGREHHVYSGLCLWTLPTGEVHVNVERTTLRMDALADALLEDYLASGLWEGKAGAFGYQDRVGWLQIVEGSETNVVGLPMERLETMLDKLRFPAEN